MPEQSKKFRDPFSSAKELRMHVPLRAISVFHAVARAGSISRAAEELRVTPSAVSQQIHSLEIHLGTALTVKVGRNVMLTEAGELYFRLIDHEVERIVEATTRVRGLRSVTTLTIRAAPSVSAKWLLPRLPSFVEAHPDIEVRLDGTNEPTAFDKENVDVEIRHGEGEWPGLFAEGLGEERFMPLCAPSFAAANSLDASELPGRRLIHSVKSQMQWPVFFAAAGVDAPAHWRRVHFDRTHMAIDYAAGCGGIALESNLMAWRELASGALVCPVRNTPRLTLVTQWIVCPPHYLRRMKNAVFIAWLRTQRDAWETSRFVPND